VPGNLMERELVCGDNIKMQHMEGDFSGGDIYYTD
jgi:hypothetical protein